MKSWSLAAPAFLAVGTTALVQMEVRYSERLVNIGDLDLQQVTVAAINEAPGNSRSVLTDDDYQSFTNTCRDEIFTDPDTSVTVQIDGAWGQTPGLELDQMRGGLVLTMIKTLNEIAIKNTVELFSVCTGFSGFELARFETNPACAPETHIHETPVETCVSACGSINSGVGCAEVVNGISVPASIRVNAFIDDVLQPDSLEISFSATSTGSEDGCGIVGEIAGILAGFIPGPGALFSAGVGIACGA